MKGRDLQFLIFVSNFIFAFSSQCQIFNFTSYRNSASVCKNILPSSYQVYVGDTTCLQSIEQDVASGFPSLWFSLSSPCRVAVSKYQCILAFPGCAFQDIGNNQTILSSQPPCTEVCSQIQQNCNSTDTNILSSHGVHPNSCTNSSCVSIPDPTSVPVPKCESYSGKVCKGIIDYPVYIPPTSTQAKLEAAVASLTRVFAIAPRDNDCQKHTAAYYCSQTFMRCDTGVIGRVNPAAANLTYMQIPFPRYPCKSTCLNFNASCAGLFQLNAGLIPNCYATGNGPDAHKNCSGVFTNPGQDNFPVSETIFSNTSGVVLYSECNALPVTSFSKTIAAFSDCPFPLVQPEDYSMVDTWVLGSCALPCPLYTSNKDVLRRQDILYTVVTWLSVIYFPIIALPYFLWPAKRKHFHLMNLFIGGVLGVFGPLSGAFKGAQRGDPTLLDLSIKTTNLRCMNNAMAANSKVSSICSFVGFIAPVGGIATSCWWLIVAYDIFSQVVLEKPRINWSSWKIRLGCLLYGWGLPILLGTIVVNISPVSALGSWQCGVTNSNDRWGFNTAPLIWNIAVGSPMLFLTFVKVMKVGNNVGRIPKEAFRLLFLLFFFFFDFVYVFITTGYLYNQTPAISAATKAWLKCLLQHMGPTALDVCGTEPTKVISPSILYPLIFFAGSTGLILAILFTDFNVFRLWIYFFSSPNPFSLSKMVDSNVSRVLKDAKVPHNSREPNSRDNNSRDTPHKHSTHSSKPPIELVKLDTTAETIPLQQEETDVENKSPSIIYEKKSGQSIDESQEGRALFNPFALEPTLTPPSPERSSSPSTPKGRSSTLKKDPLRTPESPSVDASSSPLYFSLPAVSEQPLDESTQEDHTEEQTEEHTVEDIPSDPLSESGTQVHPLVKSVSLTDSTTPLVPSPSTDS